MPNKLHRYIYIPSFVKTLVIICMSHNVRCTFYLMSRLDDYSTHAKVDGKRLLPFGVTQLCLNLEQAAFIICLKFNSRVVELFTAKVVDSNVYPFGLVYLSSFNIFIDRPLTLYNQCLARVYQLGYTHQTLSSDRVPITVQNDLFFPLRKSLKYEDSEGNIVFTCVSCEPAVSVL